ADYQAQALAVRYLGWPLLAEKQYEPAALAAYGIAALTDLKQKIWQRLQTEDLQHLYDEIEQPLIQVLADMEATGIVVSRSTLEGLNREF
ncbi:MAG: hypothetical protein OSJ64_09425, partial [Firmicutes bacterium]|nr:hypothetical protein [Bacillota bacterium]